MVLGSAQQGKWMDPLHSAPCSWSSLETPRPISLLLLLRVRWGKWEEVRQALGKGQAQRRPTWYLLVPDACQRPQVAD